MRRECDEPHQAAPFCTVSRQVQQAGSLIANGIKLRRAELHVAVFVNPATQRKSAGERWQPIEIAGSVRGAEQALRR